MSVCFNLFKQTRQGGHMSSRRAVIIGLNRYLGGRDLNAPSNDAQCIYNLIEQHGNFNEIKLLPCKKVGMIDPAGRLSESGLRESIKGLFKGDGRRFRTAFFYFAGHGTREQNEDVNTNEKNWESYLSSSEKLNAFPLSALRTLIKNCRADEKIIWLDCCHSGEILNFSLFKDQEALILASSLSTEAAYETDGHGVFTKIIIEGLDSILRERSKVTSSALIDYVEENTKALMQDCRYGYPVDAIELLRKLAPTELNLPPRSPERLRDQGVDLDLYRDYLRTVRKECQSLPLAAIAPGRDDSVTMLLLPQVYVDLQLIEAQRTPSSLKDGYPAGTRQLFLETLDKPVHRFAVLRGDVGAGKSTVISRLAYLLSDPVLRETPSELSKILEGLIPVRLLMNDLASLIPNDGMPGKAGVIWAMIEAELVRCCGKISGQRLFNVLKPPLRAQGYLLLDGLDEVTEKGQQRRRLLEALTDFTDELGDEARILVTTRPHALSDDDRRTDLPSFCVLDLAPMNQELIHRFVNKWFEAARDKLEWDPSTFSQRLQTLQTILSNRSDLAALAARPLLLTLITVLHTSRTKLPGDRAELFEEAVDLLLSRWDRTLDAINDAGTPLLSDTIIHVLRSQPDRIRKGLQALAYKLHCRQQGERKGDDDVSGLEARDILFLFANLLPVDINPKALLGFLDHRSGLLFRQSHGQYTFPHRAFQEYLAACHMVDQSDRLSDELVRAVRGDLDWWREVFLFALGKISRGSMANAFELLMVLVPRDWSKVDSAASWDWQAAILGGQGMIELRTTERALTSPLGELLTKRLTGWLSHLLDKGVLSPSERAEAGDILGRLGDPRPGVGLDESGMPDIEWEEVETGLFNIAAGADQRRMNMERFDIARYPVTVAQFRAFISSNGYKIKGFWSDRGWSWRNHNQRTYPTDWKEQVPFPNRPVVGVSWYEAMAYSSWLRTELKQNIGLPSEEEWEYAARGSVERPYPWVHSEDWDEQLSNADNSSIGHATAVGMYPAGATPQGVFDLAGNVWEWCLNLYKEIHSLSDKGLDDPEAQGRRSARGGSWWSSSDTHRCNYRKKFVPASSDPDMGIRLIRK
jgi:formylglycine-generating enzyme required for sulfatase activity